MSEERISGTGRLVALDASAREYMVDYVLLVVQDVTGQSGTFSPPQVWTHHAISIDEKSQSIPSGPDYTLKTAEEILRVRKTPTGWIVVVD